MNVLHSENKKKATLLLADGSVYEGFSFGCEGETIGEVVFETGMVGYQEAMTDPCYYGQIVMQTFPLMGNYGANAQGNESEKAYLNAYIAREWCEAPSNFRCEEDMDSFMKKMGVIGIYGIDTRALTRKLRDEGVQNGMVTTSPITDKEAALEKIRAYGVKDAVKSVSRKEAVSLGDGLGHPVAVVDLGGKQSVINGLLTHGCKVTVYPYNVSPEQVQADGAEGIFLTEGPGNPEENADLIETVKALLSLSIPTFGVGLGHELMALARGAKISKMKHGHRGANQPVVSKEYNRTFVTSQNHGYVVEKESVTAAVGEITYENANDGTCAGIRYSGIPAFSVQFDPVMWAGPMESGFLYETFVNMMERK